MRSIDNIGILADAWVMHYPGGKGKSFQHIINVLPPHDTYIETHLGGGAVLRHKAPARTTIAVEIDPVVIDRWRAESPGLASYVEADANAFLRDKFVFLRREDLQPVALRESFTSGIFWKKIGTWKCREDRKAPR